MVLYTFVSLFLFLCVALVATHFDKFVYIINFCHIKWCSDNDVNIFSFVLFLVIDIGVSRRQERCEFTTTVTPCFTVQELKDIVVIHLQMLFQKFRSQRFRLSDIRLHYQETQLQDDSTLSSYNITDDADIEVEGR